MSPNLMTYLQHNWPLAIVAVGLLIFVPIVILTGVFPTNQGNVLRTSNRSGYWRWVTWFVVLLVVSWFVLIGSFFLTAH